LRRHVMMVVSDEPGGGVTVDVGDVVVKHEAWDRGEVVSQH
jgi:hypothetical protein